jgi:hypothetical protein
MRARFVINIIEELLEGFKLGSLGVKKPKPFTPLKSQPEPEPEPEPASQPQSRKPPTPAPIGSPAPVRPSSPRPFSGFPATHTTVWNEGVLKQRLEQDNAFVRESLRYLYQLHKNPNHKFNFLRFNSNFMTSVGEWVERGKPFTSKQAAAVGKILIKTYWKWLLPVAHEIEHRVFTS